MLVLILKAGDNRYALDSSAVVEVIPRVALQTIPTAPATLAGVFQYRGEIVPVVDVCQRLEHVPCEGQLASRIVVLRKAPGSGGPQYLGLMVDAVLEARRLDAKDRVTGTHNVMSDDGGMLQWLAADAVSAWSAELH